MLSCRNNYIFCGNSLHEPKNNVTVQHPSRRQCIQPPSQSSAHTRGYSSERFGKTSAPTRNMRFFFVQLQLRHLKALPIKEGSREVSHWKRADSTKHAREFPGDSIQHAGGVCFWSTARQRAQSMGRQTKQQSPLHLLTTALW